MDGLVGPTPKWVLPHLFQGSLIFPGQGAKLRRAGNHQPGHCGHSVDLWDGTGDIPVLENVEIAQHIPITCFSLFSFQAQA